MMMMMMMMILVMLLLKDNHVSSPLITPHNRCEQQGPKCVSNILRTLPSRLVQPYSGVTKTSHCSLWHVYPACSDGSYGLGCMSACGNCSPGDVCDKVNGACPHGCQPGFRPSDPLCNDSKLH